MAHEEERREDEPPHKRIRLEPPGGERKLSSPGGNENKAPTDTAGQQPTEPAAAQQQQQPQASGQAGSGMNNLPRPPPLTIPTDASGLGALGGNLSMLGAGFSPLPSILGSPFFNLDSLLSAHHSNSAAASPSIQLLFNQFATSLATGRGAASSGSGVDAAAGAGANGLAVNGIKDSGGLPSGIITPAGIAPLDGLASALISPHMLGLSLGLGLDTSRGASGGRNLMDFNDQLASMDDLDAEAALGSLADGVLKGSGKAANVAGGLAAAKAGSSAANGSGGIVHIKQEGSTPNQAAANAASGQAMLPLQSPAVYGAGMYKGINYDRERKVWQLVLWDGAQFRTLGEYHNELEALVAQELLSPAVHAGAGGSGMGEGGQAANGSSADLMGLLPGGLSAGATPSSFHDVVARYTTASALLAAGNLHHASSPAGPPGAALLSPGTLSALVSPLGVNLAGSMHALLHGGPTPRPGGAIGKRPDDAKESEVYHGVAYRSDKRRWQAYVLDEEGKHIFLPQLYDSEEAAARAHDAEALRRYGERATLNFPGDEDDDGEEEGLAGLASRGRGRGRGVRRPRGDSDEDYEGEDDDEEPYDEADSDYSEGDEDGGRRHRGRRGGGMLGRGGRGGGMYDARGTPGRGGYHRMGMGRGAAAAGLGQGIKRGRLEASRFRGVSWDEARGKWRAQYWDANRAVVVEHYDREEDAARAYDAMVVRSGRKEKLNFPQPGRPGGPGGKVTSQYKGVSWNSACSKWVAVLWDRELKRARHIGSFELEEDAARAYDREALKMLGPEAGLNFRESLDDYLASVGDGAAGGDGGSAGGKGSSTYRGVSWHERSQRWEVRVWGGGKQHFIGSFTSEVEAARAYDKAVLRLRGPDARSRSRMNFPVTDYNMDEIMAEPLTAAHRALLAAAAAGGDSPGHGEEGEGGVDAEGMEGAGGNTLRSGRKVRRRREDDAANDSELDELDEEMETAKQRKAMGASATPPPAPLPAVGGLGSLLPFMPLLDVNGAPLNMGLPGPQVQFDGAQGKWVMSVAGLPMGVYDDEASAQAAGAQYQAAMNSSVMTSGLPGLGAQPAVDLEGLLSGGGLDDGGRGGGGAGRTRTTGQRKAAAGVRAAVAAAAAAQDEYVPPGGAYSTDRQAAGNRRMQRDAANVHAAAAAAAQLAVAGGEGSFAVAQAQPVALYAPIVAPGVRGKSIYRGVSWCEKVKKWRALLWDGHKQRFLGHFTTDLDAARAYDRALLDLKGPDAKTNFPKEQYDLTALGGDSEYGYGGTGHRRGATSQYKGVCYNKHSGKYECRLRLAGRNLYLGSFDDEAGAARVYDAASLHLRSNSAITNFNADLYTDEDIADAVQRIQQAQIAADEGDPRGGRPGAGSGARRTYQRRGGGADDGDGIQVHCCRIIPTASTLQLEAWLQFKSRQRHILGAELAELLFPQPHAQAPSTPCAGAGTVPARRLHAAADASGVAAVSGHDSHRHVAPVATRCQQQQQQQGEPLPIPGCRGTPRSRIVQPCAQQCACTASQRALALGLYHHSSGQGCGVWATGGQASLKSSGPQSSTVQSGVRCA